MLGWGKLPTQDLLDSKRVLIFEFIDELYLWIGSQVSFPDRRSAQQLAKHLWKKYPRSAFALFGRLTEHRETALFTEKFEDWIRPNQENILTPIQHKDYKLKETKTKSSEASEYKPVFIDLTKENPKFEIKCGKFNVADGDGEIIDNDGRIMKIHTLSYKILQTNNGVLGGGLYFQ